MGAHAEANGRSATIAARCGQWLYGNSIGARAAAQWLYGNSIGAHAAANGSAAIRLVSALRSIAEPPFPLSLPLPSSPFLSFSFPFLSFPFLSSSPFLPPYLSPSLSLSLSFFFFFVCLFVSLIFFSKRSSISNNNHQALE